MKGKIDFKSALERSVPWLFGGYLVSLLTSMSGMEIFSSLLCLAALALAILRRERPPKAFPPLLAGLILFVAAVGLSIVLGSATTSEKWADASRCRFVLWFLALAYLFARDLRDFPWLKVLGLAAALVGFYAAVQHFVPFDLVRAAGHKLVIYAIPETKTGLAVFGTFNHHLTFANVFLLHAALFFSVGVGDPWRRWHSLLLGIFLFLLCLWSQSRAAWMAVPFTAFVIALGKSRRVALGVLVAGLATLALLYYSDSGFRQRFERTFLQDDDFYNGGPRHRLWRANWRMFLDHPWLGLGWNNNERKAKAYVDRLFPRRSDNFYGHAHSEFFQLLASTGILGFLSYVILWAAVFLRLFRSATRLSLDGIDRWVALGLIGAFVGFHLQGLTQWNFGDGEVLHNVVFFWAVAAHLGQPRHVAA